MREFKFRVWDFNTKNFVTDKNEDGWAEEWCITPDGRLLCDHGRSGYLPSQVEVSFWTGLQDKNGIEIFEGDIVKSDMYYEGKATTVKWDGDYFYPIQYYMSPEDFKVIGNIYENPELLEAKDG